MDFYFFFWQFADVYSAQEVYHSTYFTAGNHHTWVILFVCLFLGLCFCSALFCFSFKIPLILDHIKLITCVISSEYWMSDFYVQIEKSKERDLCSFFEDIGVYILVKRGKKSAAFIFVSHSSYCYTGFKSSLRHFQWLCLCLVLEAPKLWIASNRQILTSPKNADSVAVCFCRVTVWVKSENIYEAKWVLPVVRSENSLLTDIYIIFHEKLGRIC